MSCAEDIGIIDLESYHVIIVIGAQTLEVSSQCKWNVLDFIKILGPFEFVQIPGAGIGFLGQTHTNTN